ncbi:MAG TPA: C39 family peptidase [Ktedonobacteraceae bacterium]|jgi:predicted double-glycine peptidase|nr:C39 family peptidase [Ktedonobacteraceae bacterium]
MPMLLIPLLAVSLIITLVGLLLSPKPQARDQRPPSYPSMRGRRRVYDPVDTEPVRARRYRASTEEPALLSLSIPALWGRAMGRDAGEPLPWKVIIIGLVAIFILGFYSLNLLLPHPASFGPTWFLSQDASAAQQTPGSGGSAYNASQKLVRISQLDPSQYSSTQEYNLWAYSACSAASMTEVINAYGHHYRITAILRVEAQLGAITPQFGLLRDSGIAETVAKFGFKTDWGYNRSLAQIIAIANQGKPVIVDFPPSKYPQGHLLVVIGGNSSSVYLADSSIYNRHSVSHQQFMQWWGGFSAIVTPK